MAALDEIHVIKLSHLWSPSTEVGVLEGVEAAANLDAAADGGAHVGAGFAEFMDGVVVLVSDAFAFLKFQEVVDVGNDGRLLGQGEDIGTQAEDLGGDVGVGPVDEADHGYYGGDADDHTDEREHAAKLVCPEAGSGDGNGLEQMEFGGTGHRETVISFASLLGIRTEEGLNYRSAGTEQAFIDE